MTIEQIQACNPEYEFYTTQSTQFQEFGRVLAYDANSWIQYANTAYPLPDKKASYFPDGEDLHNFSLIDAIQQDIFGHLAIQTGIVQGKNEYLTGIEFHQGSEVNIALTDCILVVGRRQDMIGVNYDGGLTKKFYLHKGEVVEIYASTLHYTPIQATSEGFSLGVILLEGTNTDIGPTSQTMLTKKNKWYITHASQTEKVKAGCIAGLQGELLHIKHCK